MRQIRLLMAITDRGLRDQLKGVLQHERIQVVSEVSDGASLLLAARSLSPNLVLLEAERSGSRDLELARAVYQEQLATVILVEDENLDLSGWATVGQAFTCVFKPITRQKVLSAMDIALLHRERLEELKVRIKELEGRLEARKTIERAKGMLMERCDISEERAYRLMQKRSMDQGIPIKKVAEAIVLVHVLEEKNKGV